MNEQDVERLADVLGNHYAVIFLNGVWCCPCGVVLAEHEVDANLRKDRHLATVLAPAVAAARADGRESLAGEIRALADQIGVAKDGAARWARETSTSFREAMSRKVAYEWCEKELRALVAPTGHDGETGPPPPPERPAPLPDPVVPTS